jgi:excinuclease ABC subunit C
MRNKYFQNQIYYPSDLDELPINSGVYSYYDQNDDLLYIGKSNCLKKRISSYFTLNILDDKTRELVKKIHHIRIIKVSSDFEALLLEAKLINFYLPKYNIIWKDDKHYIYIEITKENFPRVILSRQKKLQGSILFGPYPSTRIVQDIIKYARIIFPFCSQRRNIHHPCFYSHLGLCNPCPGSLNLSISKDYRILKRKYRQNIRGLITLLNGEMSKINKLLSEKMHDSANKKNFEEAIQWRNKLNQFQYLLAEYHSPENYMFNPYYYEITIQNELKDLKIQLEKLEIKLKALNRIECYDISNISGHDAVGSMIVFINGEPAKKEYRHFRIRSKTSPDDFIMMSEILKRRMNHQEWHMPDLIIIDGGKPQLNALKNIMVQFTNIHFIGIAKKFEEIVFPLHGTFQKRKLPSDTPGQHLLLRIRDEAHRFAHDYHLKLRLKKLYQ